MSILILRPASCPHRLAWPRTPAFQAGNTGSNPVGDTTHYAVPVSAAEPRVVGEFEFTSDCGYT